MTIIVTRRMRKRELAAIGATEPEKLFAKMKDKRDLAVPISWFPIARAAYLMAQPRPPIVGL